MGTKAVVKEKDTQLAVCSALNLLRTPPPPFSPGYSLNALVDFPLDNPVEIIKHLMIGSEGTFGFVSRATYNTVPEWPNKASAFIMFPDVRTACKCV